MSLQSSFLDALKHRFIEVIGEREFGGSPSKTQAPYYLKNLADNLVVEMPEKHRREYEAGDGDELEKKMKSLRSSSAMTFNLLGADPVVIIENRFLPSGTYDVQFEYQLPTLSQNPRKANLDALLTTRDGMTEIYCEMKLAEWMLGKATNLRRPYLDMTNYLIPPESASAFVLVFRRLCSETGPEAERIPPKLRRYDAFQMLKHLLAIYSDCHMRKECGKRIPNRVYLANCVWEMTNPSVLGKYEDTYLSILSEERFQFGAFREVILPIYALFEKLDIVFSLVYISFSDFMHARELDGEHARRLQRYIV